MAWSAWYTLAVVVAVVVALVKDVASPAAVVFAGMVAVLVAGVIGPGQALSGFSNPAPVTVGALYILAAGVEKTGALTPLVGATLGDRGHVRRPLGRLLGATVGASAFLNNTPIVAMLSPQVSAWAERHRVSPSKFLMPLSFGAILGGVVTVIGTSTNLVISGLLEQSGRAPLGFFEITKAGLPIAAAGTVFLVLASPRLLPARRSVREELEEQSRRFSIEMVVERGGPLVGKEVGEGGLRHLAGVFLAALERGGHTVAPVTPDTVLAGDDVLRFVGHAEQVVDLQNIRGLRSAEAKHVLEVLDPGVRYFEAVVGASSPLVGHTLRDLGFRGRYQAAVIAIHRAGQLVAAKLGTVELHVGDTLLVVADPGFRGRWRDRSDFLLVSEMGAKPPVASRKAWWVAVIGVGLVVTAATGVLSILEASLLAAIALVAVGVLSPGEARGAVDLEVVVVIASAFGLAAAVESSGLARTVADGLVRTFGFMGNRGVLLAVVLATILLTELVTNNAAALLMYPIAVQAGLESGLNPRGLAVTVAVAASASFLTPIGYQTNTMVYGPGGYRFSDYSRLGLPLTILVVTALVVLVPWLWPL